MAINNAQDSVPACTWGRSAAKVGQFFIHKNWTMFRKSSQNETRIIDDIYWKKEWKLQLLGIFIHAILRDSSSTIFFK
jgi:hypothetical protein